MSLFGDCGEDFLPYLTMLDVSSSASRTLEILNTPPSVVCSNDQNDGKQ